MVVVSLALDTPKLTPMVTAWERESMEPEAAPHEVRWLFVRNGRMRSVHVYAPMTQQQRV